MLATHPKARTGVESRLFTGYIGPQLRAWQSDLDRELAGGGVGLGGYMREAEFMKNLRQYMVGLIKPMIGNLEQDEFFIEKTPSHALWLPEIVEMLPKSRIIHIIRDARDVVASLLAASKVFLGKGWAPANASEAASIWVNHIRSAQAAAKDLPKEQYYELRYEELLRSTMSAMQNLSKFLDLRWHEAELIKAIENNSPKLVREQGTRIPVAGEFHAISGREVAQRHGFVRKAEEGSWRRDLSPMEKFAVWRKARTTMNELGYFWKYPW